MKLTSSKRALSLLAPLVAAGLLQIACGDDPTEPDGGGGQGGETGTGGHTHGGGGESATGGNAATGGGGAGGAEPLPEAGAGIETAATRVLDNALNAYGATFSRDGFLYVSGVTDTALPTDAQANGNLRLAVWRFTEENVLDSSFGTNGVAISTIENPGTSYDILELADGTFVVHLSGGAPGVSLVRLDVSDADSPTFSAPTPVVFGWSASHITAVNDLCVAATETTECVAAKTNTAGGVCETSGVNYDADDCEDALAACLATEAALDCTEAWPAATAPLFAQRPGSNTSWGIGLDKSGTSEKVVVFGFGPARRVTSGVQRTDNDRYVARVLASNFSNDATFNGGSAFTMDVLGAGLPDNARRGFVEADGSIVSAGYGPTTNGGDDNHVHLLRLTANGALDPDFGFSDNEGVFPTVPGRTHFNPFRGDGGMAEAYSAIPAGPGRYLTTGYGRSFFEKPTVENDVVTFRVNFDGLDSAWGGNAAGDGKFGSFAIQSETDPGAGIGTRPYRDNGRDLVLLPDGRSAQVGCYDDFAAIFIVDEDGRLDTRVGGGTGRIQFTHPFPFFKATLSADGTRLATIAQSRPKASASGVNARAFVAILAVDAE